MPTELSDRPVTGDMETKAHSNLMQLRHSIMCEHCTLVCFKYQCIYNKNTKTNSLDRKTLKNMDLEIVCQELTSIINSTFCPWGQRIKPLSQYTTYVPFPQHHAIAIVNGTSFIYRNIKGIPWQSSGWDSALSPSRVWVQSLAGKWDPASHTMWPIKKKGNKK